MSQDHDLSKLPDFCYSTLYSTGAIILIRKGKSGYCSTPYSVEDRRVNMEIADRMNAGLGVSRAQELAMLSGSMSGWDKPTADPEYWIKREKMFRRSELIGREIAVSFNDGKYFLHVKSIEIGYDYTIYRADYSIYTRGQLREPMMSIEKAIIHIIYDDTDLIGSFRIARCPLSELKKSISQEENTALHEK